MKPILLTLLGLLGCSSSQCDPTHPQTAALLAECKLRVQRECPALTYDECPVGKPCPQCPAVEECDAATRELCQ